MNQSENNYLSIDHFETFIANKIFKNSEYIRHNFWTDYQ